MTKNPDLSLSVQLGRTHQLSLIDCGEDEQTRQNIIQHAIAAIEAYIRCAESAVTLCIRLYECREEFRATGETGWQKFAKDNFISRLGMSESQIRSAVSAGKALVRHLERADENNSAATIAMLQSMSMAALVQIGHAPDEVKDDLIERIASRIEESGGSKMPTARDVSAEVNELKSELSEKTNRLGEMERIVTLLNNQVRDLNESASSQRKHIDKLNHELSEIERKQVTVLEPDPQSQEAKKQIQAIEEEMQLAKRELDATNYKLEQMQAEASRLEAKSRLKVDADDSMARLMEQVNQLRATWAEAYVQKIKRVDPERYAPIFEKISDDLHSLADAMNPTLFN